ncbi:MAG: hypothetical protein JJ974_12970, partial [Phycisphaerales bacterium]|nr:hypothetical protein [Phycisphaerales bacterium]
VDIFTIDLLQGAVLDLTLLMEPSSPQDQLAMILLDPDGQIPLALAESEGPEVQAINGFEAPFAGPFVIIIEHLSGEPVPYVLDARVEGGPPEPCGDDQLEPGIPNAAPITSPGIYEQLSVCGQDTVDLFSFRLEAGDVFSVALDTDNPQLSVELVEIFEQQIRFVPDAPGLPISLEATIETPGIYVLVVATEEITETIYDMEVSISGADDCGEDVLEEEARQQIPIGPGTFEGLALCEEDLRDTFRVVAEGGESLTATINFAREDADLSLLLLDAQFQVLALSETEQNTETVTAVLEFPGEYAIMVINETGTPVDYVLEVLVENDPIDPPECQPDGFEPNDEPGGATEFEGFAQAGLCEGDVDFYVLFLPPGVPFNFVLTMLGGDTEQVSMTLFELDGETIVAEGQPVDPEFMLIEGFALPTPEPHLLAIELVQGPPTDYTIEVSEAP